jgi:putative methyltransferase (TIGR04325 family)
MIRTFLRGRKSAAVPTQTPIKPNPFIWEGVFTHFRDVPESGPGFSGDSWISSIERDTAQAWAALRSEGSVIPHNIPPHHACFAQVVATLARPHQMLRVLDLGGGMGASYVNTRRCLGPNVELDYWVVDNERSCQTGSAMASGDASLHFDSRVPTELDKIDLLLLSAMLQFVEDYQGLLEMLAAHRPEYWILCFVPAGSEIPTFASAQMNVPGSAIPVWFFNL